MIIFAANCLIDDDLTRWTYPTHFRVRTPAGCLEKSAGGVLMGHCRLTISAAFTDMSCLIRRGVNFGGTTVPGRERAALAAWGRWVRRVRLALRTLGAQGTLPAQGLAGAPDMTFFIHCALRALIQYSFVASRTSLRPCLWRGASPVGRVRSAAFLSILKLL